MKMMMNSTDKKVLDQLVVSFFAEKDKSSRASKLDRPHVAMSSCGCGSKP